MTIDDYIALLGGACREKPKFLALTTAVLQQAVDLQTVIQDLNKAFSVDYATGAQLDILAATLGLSRRDTIDGIDIMEETFRRFIKRKLARWSWDGINETVPEIILKQLSNSTQNDLMDGSVFVTTGGLYLETVPGKLFPVPAGIMTGGGIYQ